jgi:hypothetical protein
MVAVELRRAASLAVAADPHRSRVLVPRPSRARSHERRSCMAPSGFAVPLQLGGARLANVDDRQTLPMDQAYLRVLHHAGPAMPSNRSATATGLNTFGTQPTGPDPSAKHAALGAAPVAKVARLARWARVDGCGAPRAVWLSLDTQKRLFRNRSW